MASMDNVDQHVLPVERKYPGKRDTNAKSKDAVSKNREKQAGTNLSSSIKEQSRMSGEREKPPMRKSSTTTRTWRQSQYSNSYLMSRSKEIRTSADAKRNSYNYTHKE